MTRVTISLLCAALAVAGSVTASADGFWLFRAARRHHAPETSFQRIATFANYRNNADAGDQTVSEIVAATADGRTLLYTDAAMGEVGFIDITVPSRPQPGGKLSLDPNPSDAIPYVPTSVDVLGNVYALVAVDTSTSLTAPSGVLAVVHLASRTVVREIDLGGQPDSVRISPDERYAAIAIENQRSETLCAGGGDGGLETVDDPDHVPGVNTTEDLCAAGGGVVGGLPQTPYGNPAGYLAVIELRTSNPGSWVRGDVGLTGLASYAPADPEPEFVDINGRNEAVVTLQENNHVAVVDLRRRAVVGDFPAGDVTLHKVDATEDGVISLTETLADVRREPDAVTWTPGPGGQMRIATANEGDLFGGSRGFTLFRRNGSIAFDSGASFEETAVRHGHYPEDRSENKGSEPEAIAYGRFAGDDYLFVGSERGSFLAVYELDAAGRPSFAQLLPAPLAPEGLLLIPQRNLVIASGEEDDPTFGVRSTVMIYELRRGRPAYPQIVSDEEKGSPIPWSALSGMVAMPGDEDSLLALWDSYYAESRILRIAVSDRPAVITDVLTVRGGRGNYDPEGIAVAPDRTLWVASEGNASDSRPNLLLQLDLAGNVMQEVGLPAAIVACRQATSRRGTLASGFEGVAVIRQGRQYRLVVAQQRGWDYTTPACESLDDDAGGLNEAGEPNWTRLWTYDPAAGTWDSVSWELAPKPADATWVGLSEITETPWGDYVVIERDNRTGDFGVLKTLARLSPRDADDGLIEHREKQLFDLRPHLTQTRGWITDKPEGLAITGAGRTFVVTDNDGVEDWSGESWFLELGRFWTLFR